MAVLLFPLFKRYFWNFWVYFVLRLLGINIFWNKFFWNNHYHNFLVMVWIEILFKTNSVFFLKNNHLIVQWWNVMVIKAGYFLWYQIAISPIIRTLRKTKNKPEPDDEVVMPALLLLIWGLNVLQFLFSSRSILFW